MQTKPLLTAMALLFSVAAASASQLTWDPNKNGGTSSGSANWDTTAGNTNWYNGSSDVLWSGTGTSPVNGAVFNGPDASAGTYVVTVDGAQMAVTNMLVNNNGYTFTGAASSNSIYIGASQFLAIAANKTATFNCSMAGSGTSPSWALGSGATMNVGGNMLGTQQLRLAGPANSVFNLTGAANAPAQVYILGPVNMTSGSIIPTSSFFIGNLNGNVINGTTYTSGSLTMSGSAVVTENHQIFFIARTGGTGTLTLQNNATVNVGTTAAFNLAVNYDGLAANVATVNVQGGTLQVGTSGTPTSQILFFDTPAALSGSTAIMNQTGGTINTWGGITFGLSGGAAGSIATFTQTGGSLNIGAGGITRVASYNGSSDIWLSGGTVGDLVSPGWSSTLPMKLSTTNGNVTFSPNNTISLSGPLTGTGGLFVNNGTLALTGTNNYSGSTVVSNGTLSVATSPSPISGLLTLDGSAGSPTATVNISPGTSWSVGGPLTTQNGTTTLSFQFGSLPPSPSVAPLQVSGSVAFTSTPNLSIGGSEIAVGTYPLITYTGSVSGTLPTVTTWSGGSASAGTLTNNTGTKTISLIVTASSVTAPLTWAVGNSTWDFGSPNWLQNGGAADYSDGDAVIFNNSATGTSPITVTLNNTTVSPLSVTFNNSSKSYIISNTGAGTITGSATLSVLGSGTNTLAGYNTYSGGTTLSAGQLNINNGGDASGSAIGTGTLTINAGAIDNTSGSNVTLQRAIPETWNGGFTYVGSANDFNTGTGSVTLGASVAVGVNGGTLTVGGAIADNFNNFQITKTGNGALTLPAANNFGGGLTVSAGQLNLGDAFAAGSGTFTINATSGCKIDNISGSSITLQTSANAWTTGFEFLGSTNLDFGAGTVVGNTAPAPVTVQVDTNTLTTEGTLTFGNVTVNKSGAGTWVISGSSGDTLNLVVEAGVVQFNKMTNQAVNGTHGLVIEAGALAQDEQDFQMHSDTFNSPQTVSLLGGTWDLNGHKENVDILAITNGGTLENSAAGTSTFVNISHLSNALSGLAYFEVDQATGVLNLFGVIAGDGTETLVKTGAGTLNLFSNEVYTGSTVISNGTIALVTNGALPNTAVINLATAASALDLTSNNSATLTLGSGQTLSGFGVVTGLVTSVSGANIAPGSSSTIGTLTVTGFVGVNTLNGTTTMKLNKTGATNDVLAVGGSLVFGGTLSLTNLSGTLSNGDSFTLFNSSTASYSGSFASITPSTPGAGLSWDTSQLDTTGTIRVMTGSTLRPAVFTPILVSGSHLTLVGTNGTTNGTYKVLTTTNLSTPLTNWVQVGSGSFGPSGNFSFGVTNTNNQAQFYILKEP